MKVALTGASGIVGQFLLRRLLAEGCQVCALVRNDATLAPQTVLAGAKLADGAEVSWVMGDLGAPQSLSRLLSGCDALVHAAFQHAPGRYRGGEGQDIATFWEVNFMGTVGLLKAARTAGIRRAVLLSSRAAFTNPEVAADGVSFDDDFPQRPDSHYGAIKVASEKLGQAFAASGDMIVSSLRPTGVYGLVVPLERTKWYELAQGVLTGSKPKDAAFDTAITTEIHGQDVAAALWRILTAPQSKVNGRGFNCSDVLVSKAHILRIMTTGKGAALAHDGGSEAAGSMSCTGLRQLGWQPGGEILLNATIAELMEKCRVATEPD